MTLGAAASLRPLRHRSFALLWAAGLISTVGSWMQTVAVGALVISRTGQASWVVLVTAGAFLPIGLLSPIGGALADRLPRRAVLAAGNLAAAATAAVIAALVAAGQASPAALLGLVTLQGAVSALIGPFLQAILPDLVPRADFLAAASLNSAQFNLGRIAGPALAGAAIVTLGYPAAFAANAASFLAVVAALMFVRLARPTGRAEPVTAAVRGGLRAARAEPSCRAAITAMAVIAFLAAPFIALVPAMARHLAGGGGQIAQATSLLTTAQGMGAVAGALCLAPLALRLGRGRVLRWSIALLPAALAAYGASGTIWVAAASLFALGLVYNSVLSGLSTVVQLRSPAAFRGRVLSLFLVALGVAYPVGALAQGPAADLIGIGWTTVAAAALLALVLVAAMARRPALARALTADQVGPAPPGLLACRPDHGDETVCMDTEMVEDMPCRTGSGSPPRSRPG